MRIVYLHIIEGEFYVEEETIYTVQRQLLELLPLIEDWNLAAEIDVDFYHRFILIDETDETDDTDPQPYRRPAPQHDEEFEYWG